MDFPRMKGNARMALGASEFDVPLFSQITDKLWTGCSPAEFPDEHEGVEYDYTRSMFIPYARPVNCHWLTIPVGHTPEIRVPRFNAILDLYGEPYVVPEETLYVRTTLYDSRDLPPAEKIDMLAFRVIEWLEEGRTVLVHCQAGLNRSALVAARALMRWMPYGDIVTADEAIKLIREKRSPMCLCNRHFERFLREFDGSALLG